MPKHYYLARAIKVRVQDNRGVWVVPHKSTGCPCTVLGQIAAYTEPKYEYTLNELLLNAWDVKQKRHVK